MRGLDRGFIVEIVGSVQDLSDLLLHRVLVVLVAVAEREYADSGHEVQVLLAIHIVEIHTFAVIEHHLVAVISVQQVCLGLVDHLFHHFTHFWRLPAVKTAFI